MVSLCAKKFDKEFKVDAPIVLNDPLTKKDACTGQVFIVIIRWLTGR